MTWGKSKRRGKFTKRKGGEKLAPDRGFLDAEKAAKKQGGKRTEAGHLAAKGRTKEEYLNSGAEGNSKT